jgi:CRP-like cAMP-binding protein
MAHTGVWIASGDLSSAVCTAWPRGQRGDLIGQAAARAPIIDRAHDLGEGATAMQILSGLGLAQAFWGSLERTRATFIRARSGADAQRTAHRESWADAHLTCAEALQERAPSPTARALARADLFTGVPAATLEQLARQTTISRFQTGSVVARRGTPISLIYVVASGRLTASRDTDHADLAETLFGPGDLVGERGVLAGQHHACTVLALEDCCLIGLQRAHLLGLLAEHPAICERLVLRLRQRLRADARISGDAAPADIGCALLHALQEVAPGASRTTSVYEILPLTVRDGLVWFLHPRDQASWQVAAPVDRAPGPFIGATLTARGLRGEIVHSTSWRYERGILILTYVAIVTSVPAAPTGFAAIPVRRTDLARGSARDAPSTIAVAQVVEHGLRHLAWLSTDDPVIGHQLNSAWRAVVASYAPEPFRAL